MQGGADGSTADDTAYAVDRRCGAEEPIPDEGDDVTIEEERLLFYGDEPGDDGRL